MSEQQFNQTENKYFSMVPHMATDDLGPYEFKLYCYYLRVCGQSYRPCKETTKRTAENTKMSVGKVSECRKTLEKMGYISIEVKTLFGTVKQLTISIADVMPENANRYSKGTVHNMNRSSPHESADTPHESADTPHECINKNKRLRITEEEKEREGSSDAEPSAPGNQPDQISPSPFTPILDDNPNFNTPADTTPKVSVSKPKKLRQQPTPHIDPRKFQNGYIPTGTGETAAEIWCERFKFLDRYKNRVLTVPLEEDIVKAATDLDLWRETVTAWDQAGYSPKNIKGMLDWYAGGGSSNRNKGSNNEYSNSNGNGQQPVHQWTGNLKNGSHNHILEQHIPDDVFDPVDW